MPSLIGTSTGITIFREQGINWVIINGTVSSREPSGILKIGVTSVTD